MCGWVIGYLNCLVMRLVPKLVVVVWRLVSQVVCWVGLVIMCGSKLLCCCLGLGSLSCFLGWVWFCDWFLSCCLLLEDWFPRLLWGLGFLLLVAKLLLVVVGALVP